MNRHAGPPPDPNAPPPIPEPTYAERARTLVHRARTGTLATLSRRHPGHPFASLMPYALDGAGRPLFLISTMAVHTQNLAGDPRASLFVAEPDWTGDPLAAGRITLMGAVASVQADARAEARASAGTGSTAPMSVIRPAARGSPVHSGSAMKRLARESSARFCVWTDIELMRKSGRTVPSRAYGMSDANGCPGWRRERVASVPVRARWTSVRARSA